MLVTLYMAMYTGWRRHWALIDRTRQIERDSVDCAPPDWNTDYDPCYSYGRPNRNYHNEVTDDSQWIPTDTQLLFYPIYFLCIFHLLSFSIFFADATIATQAAPTWASYLVHLN